MNLQITAIRRKWLILRVNSMVLCPAEVSSLPKLYPLQASSSKLHVLPNSELATLAVFLWCHRIFINIQIAWERKGGMKWKISALMKIFTQNLGTLENSVLLEIRRSSWNKGSLRIQWWERFKEKKWSRKTAEKQGTLEKASKSDRDRARLWHDEA